MKFSLNDLEHASLLLFDNKMNYKISKSHFNKDLIFINSRCNHTI